MTALPPDVTAISEDSLRNLIMAGAAEGLNLEFKSAPYSGDHEGVREFLKDATAFANTAGGTLLIGLRERDGTAESLVPIDPSETDNLKLRLESLLQHAVEPRIFGIRIHAVTVTGGQVLAIRVPRSLSAPHRVTAKNSNRFYLRSSAGVYEASMDELRELFTQSVELSERIQNLRDQRLRLLSENNASIPIFEGDDRLVIHIIPLAAQRPGATVGLSDIEALSSSFRPLGGSGWSPQYNLDGFANTRGGSQCHGYTQLFRDGTIEAVQVDFLSRGDTTVRLYGQKIADTLNKYIPMYIDGLQAIGVAPPFFVSLAVQGVRGALVMLGEHHFDAPQVLHRDELLLPFASITDFGSEQVYSSALKPMLDALWNAGGLSEWVPSYKGDR